MLLGKVVAGCLGIGLVLWMVVGAFQEVHYGRAAVVASGVLSIAGKEYALWAVKIPEVAETCSSPRGAWPCGAFATAAVLLQIDQKHVMCFVKSELAEGTQPAKCYASSNLLAWQDVSHELVKRGWAKPDLEVSREYEQEGIEAAATFAGTWKR